MPQVLFCDPCLPQERNGLAGWRGSGAAQGYPGKTACGGPALSRFTVRNPAAGANNRCRKQAYLVAEMAAALLRPRRRAINGSSAGQDGAAGKSLLCKPDSICYTDGETHDIKRGRRQ